MNANIIHVLIVLCTFVAVSNGRDLDVVQMKPGVAYNKKLYSENLLSIYCYRGIPKRFYHIWQTVYVAISLQPEEYTLYNGGTAEEVHVMYENHKSSWAAQFFKWRRKTITINPFNQSCVGIETSNDFTIGINIIRIDFWRVLFLALGIFFFLTAPKLSSNPIFYYICGVTLGITTSVLIALYLISRLIPRKPAVYGFMIGAWSVGLYILQVLWNNIKVIALNYQNEVVAYIFASGLVSFVICYRWGPVTDPRSKNLIKWALQCASLAAIFYSSYYQELSVLIILALLIYYNFPSSSASHLIVFWKKRFPPKRRLLTEDEYHEQGARETVAALEELRKYCSSPECKQWKTVLSLREPLRFAQFVEGDSHLVDSEILEYETESRKAHYFLTDDSDTDSDGDQ